ncbi:MAG: hypothetical protein IJG86_01965 [Clostridia bacterium]|nr:hypothetical protein [Clostridia bacterium]
MEDRQEIITPDVREDPTVEQQLEKSGELAVQTAKELKIASKEDYEKAGKYLVGIRTRTKQIQDYWKGPKQAAAAAHKAIVDKEKQMLARLKEAEQILRNSMGEYQKAVEKARKEQEEALRRKQQEEVDRLLNQAAEAGASGDAQGEAIGMAMAEMVNDMPPASQMDTPTAEGTHVRKTWKHRVTDPNAVPAYFNGMEIRTINSAALNNIARMTKGTATIPGVEFYQDTQISVRT